MHDIILFSAAKCLGGEEQLCWSLADLGMSSYFRELLQSDVF